MFTFYGLHCSTGVQNLCMYVCTYTCTKLLWVHKYVLYKCGTYVLCIGNYIVQVHNFLSKTRSSELREN